MELENSNIQNVLGICETLYPNHEMSFIQIDMSELALYRPINYNIGNKKAIDILYPNFGDFVNILEDYEYEKFIDLINSTVLTHIIYNITISYNEELDIRNTIYRIYRRVHNAMVIYGFPQLEYDLENPELESLEVYFLEIKKDIQTKLNKLSSIINDFKVTEYIEKYSEDEDNTFGFVDYPLVGFNEDGSIIQLPIYIFKKVEET